MPFKHIPGTNKYRSPSGKIWTAKQMKLYYATDGFKKSSKHYKIKK